jgi:xanthine/CO dehydrogenase XdhC/CoxF family maturation factor
MHEIDRIIEAAQRVIDANSRGVLVTVIATRGSTYRRAGARTVIQEDGGSCGTISGGCLERDLAVRVEKWLEDFTPRVVSYDSTRTDDLIFGTGLGCRGEVDMLLEPFDAARPPRLVREFRWNGREPVVWTTGALVEVIRPPRNLLIFGSGADVSPVVSIAATLGWETTVVTRPETVDLTPFDAAIVMTHNFLRDLELLETLAPTPISYIGLLGPKTRGEELLAAMTNVPAGFRDRLHSPIGLDLGGETPEEIALAIIAEVQQILQGREARPLRELGTAIHAG